MLLSSRKKETAAPSICRESVECSDSKDESFSPDSDANDSDVELLTAESGSSDAGQEEDIDVEDKTNDKFVHASGTNHGGPHDGRKRGKGVRDKFLYFLPFVGQVCRPMLALCYGVVPMTSQRYKARIRNGSITVSSHGNNRNKHAATVDM
ncbi:hypothetical protein PC117_g25456 [Phytophthora cactorum]|uniref:Uncharacterized protein n=1 Tax=Phytophthora cactorum TaxID=29920 RepID=A0A8T1AT22_9STRA|nr:hypothetical protein PC117_g25456 [Phytophthora cactorum]